MTMLKNNYISIFQTDYGVWNDKQIPNTYSHYADIAMETLLLGLLPKRKKILVKINSYLFLCKNL